MTNNIMVILKNYSLGVGPKEHLTSLGIPVQADLPVGQNLQDHLTTMLGRRAKFEYGGSKKSCPF